MQEQALLQFITYNTPSLEDGYVFENISVEFNGVDINGRDAASFGRDIANAAADNLFEAFTRRGIDAIRTLRQ